MKKINFGDIIKKTKHVFTKKVDTGYSRNVERDWLIILLCSSIACAGICAADGYIFYKLNKGELFNSVPILTLKVPMLNRTLLEQEIDFYKRHSGTTILPTAAAAPVATTSAVTAVASTTN